MNRSIIRRLFLPLLIAGSTLPIAWAGSAPRTLVLENDSSLWLLGDSTLHPFTSRTTDLKLTSEVDRTTPTSQPEALLNGTVKQIEFTIPVKSLKSKESALDKNMYKALNADHFPEIVFHLSRYGVVPSTSSARASRMTAEGTLTIAGVAKPVTLQIDAQPDDATLRVQGQYTLLMSDYGIKPPTMMLGTIKVRDPVVIHFDLRIH